MNIFARFPGGREKALTLSYDDGYIHDKRLMGILDPQGIKATFNINSKMFSEEDVTNWDRMSERQVKELYSGSGHEIATHGATHPRLEALPLPLAVDDVLEDRKNLERIFGGVVRGMAYPFGTYSEPLIAALKQIGIVYSRTTVATHDFGFPEDWMKWSSTCHHKDDALFDITERFLKDAPSHQPDHRDPWLFYLWGHSFEFDQNVGGNNWGRIEQFAQTIGGHDEIWYATNIEVYDYCQAYKQLAFSVDGQWVYNPSGLTVYFEKNKETYCVEPGKTLHLT